MVCHADHAVALFNLQEVGFIYSCLTNHRCCLCERIATLEVLRSMLFISHAAQLMALFPIMALAKHRGLNPSIWRHRHAV